MLRPLILAASILIFCTPSLVNACTCALSMGTCNGGWKLGDVIFTGTVTSKSTAIDEDSRNRNAFQFSVSESFRGAAIAGEEITVYTGLGTGDCGYPFNVGTSYLVYASQYKGKLVTSICSQTSHAARVRDIIRQLRTVQKGERVPDLFGLIGASPVKFADDPFDIKPLAGIQVRVIGSRNLEQSTTTDDEGIYSFQNLPADTYRIEIEPPAGMSTWQRNEGKTYNVDVGVQGVSGCPAGVLFMADGRIKGRVVDENGNGVAGFIMSEPADAKEAEVARTRGGTLGVTTENGDFELWLLRPTRYRLVFRPKIGGQVSFRVPPIKSEVITVGLGQHIEDFRFKVPAARQ